MAAKRKVAPGKKRSSPKKPKTKTKTKLAPPRPQGSTLRAALTEAAEMGEYTLLFADGFDDAIIGVARQFTSAPTVCYDMEHCIELLVKDGMSYEEAVEYFDFNVIGAWVGEQTPIFIERP